MKKHIKHLAGKVAHAFKKKSAHAHEEGEGLHEVHRHASQHSNKNALIAVAILVVALGVAYYIITSPTGNLSPNQIKEASVSFIEKNLAQGRKVEIKKIEEVQGLYRIEVSLDDSSTSIESFVTKDGKIFFPEALYTDYQGGQKPAN